MIMLSELVFDIKGNVMGVAIIHSNSAEEMTKN